LAVAERLYRQRQQCLEALCEERYLQAFRHAKECARLAADRQSRKLLAVCALLAHEWPRALATARELRDDA
jgi:hypothetical protein